MVILTPDLIRSSRLGLRRWGTATGFLIRWSVVRVHPGVPTPTPLGKHTNRPFSPQMTHPRGMLEGGRQWTNRDGPRRVGTWGVAMAWKWKRAVPWAHDHAAHG